MKSILINCVTKHLVRYQMRHCDDLLRCENHYIMLFALSKFLHLHSIAAIIDASLAVLNHRIVDAM